MTNNFHEGALVVTSIASPNPVLKSLAEGCMARGAKFIVVGDKKSPGGFELQGCDYFSLERQKTLPFRYALECPEGSYTRKNIGYLLAIDAGAKFIVETDDDNFPLESFWGERKRVVIGKSVDNKGWVNAYKFFADEFIYPRGFPLDKARDKELHHPPKENPAGKECLIQQGLADGNPDVDAVYRMLYPLPFEFLKASPLILESGCWCPFNSQNTTFFPEVYPLLYLPAHCSFRMTDIWRSFVAQRILWTCDTAVSFHEATVFQERNEHCLQRDFEEEIPGYLNNFKIAEELNSLHLENGISHIPENMRICYDRLCSVGIIGAKEMTLLEHWLNDIAQLNF
jgi:hypothetical protein